MSNEKLRNDHFFGNSSVQRQQSWGNNNGSAGDDLSKFMQRKESQQQRRRPQSSSTSYSHQQSQRGGPMLPPHTNYVVSPTASEASDGMSQFSRRKHYNYANVVLEMKKKNEKEGGDCPPLQQQQPQGGGGRGGGGSMVLLNRNKFSSPVIAPTRPEQRKRSDEGVGTGWHTQFQQQHYSSSPYETAAAAAAPEDDKTNYDDLSNRHDDNRRRRLLHDPYTMNKNRSRSTIRRIADRTVQLNSVIKHDDNITDGDTSSVFSNSSNVYQQQNFSSGNDTEKNYFASSQSISQSGSGENDNHLEGGGGGGGGSTTKSQSKLLKRSLDSFVAKHSSSVVSSNHHHHSSPGGGGGYYADDNNDNCSVSVISTSSAINGGSSVAARRRAARHQQQQQLVSVSSLSGGGSNINSSNNNNNHGNSNNPYIEHNRRSSSSTNSNSSCIPPLHQSPGTSSSSTLPLIGSGSTVSSARSRMRMRMQGGGGGGESLSSSVLPATPPQQQQQQRQEQRPQPRINNNILTPINDISIDKEVSSALSELKLSHGDIINDSLLFVVSGSENSFDTSSQTYNTTTILHHHALVSAPTSPDSSSRCSNATASSSTSSLRPSMVVKPSLLKKGAILPTTVNNINNNNNNHGADDGGGGKYTLSGGGGRGGMIKNTINGTSLSNCVGGGGGQTSPHTVSTKSMTIAATTVGSNNNNKFSSSVITTTIAANSSSTTTATTISGPTTISPVISVDFHSESSSLTDEVFNSNNGDVNGSGGGGGGGNCGNSNNNNGGNMFKDATRMGSTFHKSKKIIRPNENSGSSSSSGGGIAEILPPAATVTTPTILTSTRQLSIPIPSLSDGTPRHTNRGPFTSPGDGDGGSGNGGGISSGSNNSSVVRNSPFFRTSPSRTIPSTPTMTMSSSYGRPPLSSPPGIDIDNNNHVVVDDNPFTVKLRTIDHRNSTTNHIYQHSPSGDRGDNNSSVCHNGADDDDDDEHNEELITTNPFLATIKLRKTGTDFFSSPSNPPPPQESDEHDKKEVEGVTEALEVTHHEYGVREEPTKQKLTYRDQQDLLRQQQQMEQENVESTMVEEPKKDVATIIRERIAASKTNSLTHLNGGYDSNDVSISSDGNLNSRRGQLKKTTPESLVPLMLTTAACAGKDMPIKHHLEAVLHSNKKNEGDVELDPRASLMAMLNKRGGASSSSSCAEEVPSVLNTRTDEPQTDPKSALMAMLAKRGEIEGASPAAVRKWTPPPAPLLPQSAFGTSLSRNINSSPSREGGTAIMKSALQNDPKYEKYVKMLKMGMPLPVVKHAMSRDGVDPSIMDDNNSKPASMAATSFGGGGGGVALKDDPAYTKYFKMLKLGLPMGAVKNAMERDGVDSSVMDGDHNAPTPSSRVSKLASSIEKKQKDTHRRTRLHWDALEETEVNSDSVWAMVEEDDELNQIEIDEKEFTTLFQAEIDASKAVSGSTGVGGCSGGSNKNVVHVIDPKRANNGGIILARLRMSYDDMARAVDAIDETAMQASQAQGIIEYMPTLIERKSLREYMKAATKGEDAVRTFERLCECEKFMVAMMTIKQSKRKIHALLFKLQFRGCIHDLAHGEHTTMELCSFALLFIDVRLTTCSLILVLLVFVDVFSIDKACDELSNSVHLRKLFGIVLNIGNRLNTAGPGQKRKAGAFSIKSLLKLNETKAFDNKTTFLHYVVLVVQRNSEALLDFKDDLPTVSKADKIYWDQCVSELEEVETQLENVRKLALYEAKSNKIKYRLLKAKSSDADNDSDDISVESMSLEDEVSLLRSTKTGMFALSAIRKVSQLRERVDMAKDKFSGLLKYLGESSDSKMQPHELFEIITKFCRTFDAVRADVERMEKAKKRDEKKDNDTPEKSDRLKPIQETHSPVSQKASPPQKRSPVLRSSYHQPNTGSVISDMKRATNSIYSTTTSSLSPASGGSVKKQQPPPSLSPLRSIPQPQLTSIYETQHKSQSSQEAEILAMEQQQIAIDAREQAARLRHIKAEAEADRLEMQRQAEEVAAANRAARIAEQQQEKANALASQQKSQVAREDNATGGITKGNAEKQSPITRREILASRRMRSRSRVPHPPTQSPPHLQQSHAPPAAAVVESTQKDVSKETTNNNNAMARERYARHQRLLQARRGRQST